MTVRLIFLLLLLANIGYYGWRVTQARDAAATGGAVAVQPLPQDVPRLKLLREREQELLAAQHTGEAAAAAGVTNCFSLGPFSNQADLRRAFNMMASSVDRSRQRQTVEVQDRGFWVYLPAMETREEALRVARDLSVAGLRDYYVVTAGEQENTISLGLFRQEENARRRQAALQQLGFDAQVARRSEESLVYWLDYARMPDTEPPWERVVASSPGVERRPIQCFL